MNRTWKQQVFVTVLAAGLTVAGWAKPITYDIDASHSSVGFKIRHFASKVRGSFEKFQGTLIVDEAKLENSSAKIVIEAASINTAHAKRDGHLRSADFFDVEHFATITFESKKVTDVTEAGFKLLGDLTLRGVTKPVVLTVEKNGSAKDFVGETRLGFSATTRINRKDFNVLWNKTFDHGGVMLGDEVDIQIEIEAVPVKK